MEKATQSKKDQLLDELLKDCKSPEDIAGEDGLLKQLMQGLMKRALHGVALDHP